MNISDTFIDHLYGIGRKELSADIRHQAKRCLLDYTGCTLAGTRFMREKGMRLLNCLNDQQTNATAIGFQRKCNMSNAAMLNGLTAHTVEMDDGERRAMIHPGAAVISAILPVTETRASKGNELLSGIVTGYEAALNLAGALQPGMKERGYHGTGTCGTIGAAMAAACILGFEREAMKHALSAAATSASGLLEVIRGHSNLKPYNAGQAALNGLHAAFVAASGFAGPEDVLGGDHGFLQLISDKYDAGALLESCQDQWAIRRIYVKPYAACRHCHAPIEAALALRSQHHISPDQVSSVHVDTYRWAVTLHDHTDIQGVESARMSIPYSVAVALVAGNAGLTEFDKKSIIKTDILALSKKVRVTASDELTALVPEKRSAIVEVQLRDGRKLSERVDLPKGEPENPMTDDELQAKFVDLAMYGGRTRQEAEAIADCVWNIEERIDELWKLIA